MSCQVSIIIVNYNTFKLTCNCIKSIIDYTNQVNYEIILVDNASTEIQENSFDEIFAGKLLVLKSDKNLGFAGGNNLGIQSAKGEYILLLNSDTELIEDSISKTYFYAKQINKLGAITCKLLNPDRKSFQNAARPFYSVKQHFIKSFGLESLFSKTFKKINQKYNLNFSFASDWIWGTFFMFPFKNLTKVGGKLSETFFMYSEDVEWCYLFAKAGLQNYYFADTAIVHYMGKSSNPLARNNAIRKSHLTFIKKYRGRFIHFINILLFFIDDITLSIKRMKRRFFYYLNKNN